MTWRWVRLKHLSAVPIVNGLGEAATLEDESWPRYIRTTDFAGPRELRDSTLATLPPEVAVKAVVQRGDILMSAAGTVGKTYIHLSDEQACFAGYLVRFRPAVGVDPRFVAYWTETPLFLDQIAAGKVTSTIDNFSAGKYQNVAIRLPPSLKQEAIADFLDTETGRIDAFIAKKRRMTDLLDERRSGTISRVLWAEPYRPVRLKHICGLPTSGNRDHSSFTLDETGVPCLRGLNVRPGRLLPDNLLRISGEDHARLRQTQLGPGDLVIVRSGNAGAAAAIPPDFGEVNCVDLVVVRRSPLLDPTYLEFVVNSREAQEQVTARSAGALLTHFNAVDAGDLTIPWSELDEQQIVTGQLRQVTAALDALSTRLKAQVALLHEHRQALITAAVTGELEVPGVAA